MYTGDTKAANADASKTDTTNAEAANAEAANADAADTTTIREPKPIDEDRRGAVGARQVALKNFHIERHLIALRLGRLQYDDGIAHCGSPIVF
jgi:hypothetical protein